MSLESLAQKLNKLFAKTKNSKPATWPRPLGYYEDILADVNFTENDFKLLYSTPKAYEDLMRMCHGTSIQTWEVRLIYHQLLTKYVHHGEKILNANSSPFFLKEQVVRQGYYQNIASIDKLILEKEKHVRVLGATICDIEKCKNLILDKEVAVRKIAFTRLGPVNFLDHMLKDRHATIRAMGVKFAPFFYPLLNDMIDDNSQLVLTLLIDKIQYEKVPFLLANKALHKQRDKVKLELKKQIEKRLERGV